jgi:hypothetical protein
MEKKRYENLRRTFPLFRSCRRINSEQRSRIVKSRTLNDLCGNGFIADWLGEDQEWNQSRRNALSQSKYEL